jgi:cytochrome c peroxidase
MLASLAGCGGRALDDLFCDGAGCDFSDREWARLQTLSPLPPVPPDPTNQFRDLPAAAALGRAFFTDARFSGLATQLDALGRPAPPARAAAGQPTGLSCASCHDAGHAGIDATSTPGDVSEGAGWTDVNALSVVNSAYNDLWFRNGRADSSWALGVGVAESPTTMNGNRLHTAWVIADNYRTAYDAVFAPAGWPLPVPGRSTDVPASTRFPLEGKPGQPAWQAMAPSDQVLIARVLVNWAKAIDAYEATLTSGEAAFDRFVREGPSSDAISAAAKRGARLFVGKAACIDCHSGPLLSDGDFHNVGVPQAGFEVPTLADCPQDTACDCVKGKGCLPWGAWDGVEKLRGNMYRRTSPWSDDPADDTRAADVDRPHANTDTDPLKGAWRTPSLRSVALTAPYMHDGIFATLAEVVDHYNRGGDAAAVGVPAPSIKPLGLTDGEQADLVAFLDALSPAAPAAPQLGAGPPLAVGDFHACDVIQGGGVQCWGENDHGVLGDGTGVVKEIAHATSVAAGHMFSCASLADGSARCWGYGYFGQLGNGGHADSATPVAVSGLAGVASVAAGGDHACALLSDRTVSCWGQESSVPVAVLGLTGVARLAAGATHECAVVADGTVRCWGSNYFGQLGNGTTVDSPTTPVTVAGLAGVTAIATGEAHACAVANNGDVFCWGANVAGQLGNAAGAPHQAAPIPVPGIADAIAVAAGSSHTCALHADGSVTCWGDNSALQLGVPDPSAEPGPVSVAGLGGPVSFLAAGRDTTCAVVNGAQVWCWGAGSLPAKAGPR